METLLVAALAISPPLTAAILGWYSLRLRRNAKPKNPHDPDTVLLGDVSVGWWEQRMKAETNRILTKLDELERAIRSK